jgi:hypothetical protein
MPSVLSGVILMIIGPFGGVVPVQMTAGAAAGGAPATNSNVVAAAPLASPPGGAGPKQGAGVATGTPGTKAAGGKAAGGKAAKGAAKGAAATAATPAAAAAAPATAAGAAPATAANVAAVSDGTEGDDMKKRSGPVAVRAVLRRQDPNEETEAEILAEDSD